MNNKSSEIKVMLFTHSTNKQVSLPWIKNIPSTWTMLRSKHVFLPIDKRSQTGEEELLSVSSEYGIVPRKSLNVTMFKAESYIGYKLCWPDDIVINSIWAWAKGLGVSKYHGIISSAYGVYRIKNKQKIDPKFIHYLIRSSPFQWEMQVRSKGIWTSRLQLTDYSFLDTPFPIPPIDEQRAIVRYLDYMDRRIRKYIRAKQKQIKLLEEYKQAIIHKAVTQGLDPNVPLKTSRVEWLGEIPEHWKVLPLKRAVKFNPSKNEAIHEFEENNNLVFLPMERISTDGKIDTSELRKAREVWSGFTYFQNGDVVIAKITPCFENGKGAIIQNIPTNCGFGTTELFVLRAYKVIDVAFLYLLSTLAIFRNTGKDNMIGAAGQKRVPIDFIKTFIIPLPPIDEQIFIAESINLTIEKFEYLRENVRKQIKLLKEYRTRLIADVVTGKLDVREAARQIPDEIEEIAEEPEEESEEEFENGEEMEEELLEEE